MTMTAIPAQPMRRTLTARQTAANKARRSLSEYGALLDPKARQDTPEGTNQRVYRLLWAQAFILQALAMETHGRLGNLHATARRLLTEAVRTENQEG